MKRRQHFADDDEHCCDLKSQRITTSVKSVKTTAEDNIVRVMRRICEYYNVFTFEDLQRAISQLFGDHLHKVRWKTLQHHSGISGIVESLNHEFRMKFVNTSFAELCKDFIMSAAVHESVSGVVSGAEHFTRSDVLGDCVS